MVIRGMNTGGLKQTFFCLIQKGTWLMVVTQLHCRILATTVHLFCDNIQEIYLPGIVN